MTKTTQESKAQSEQANPKTEQPKAKRKHTGASKRDARKRVGAPVSMKPVDLATPAKSAQAQEGNARTALAAARKERVDAETNCEAFKAIKTLAVRYSAPLAERGLPMVVVHGAELIYERLSVIVEVGAMSASTSAASTLLDDTAFVAKRRDAINRILPGIPNAPARAKFGLHEPVRPGMPQTLKQAAQRLMAGKHEDPKGRAAKLITADDEKRLKAIVKSIVKSIAASSTEQKQARAAGKSRSVEQDILNTALELFYEDFAASIGLVLEDDEVARLRALELVPRRVERRAASEEDGTTSDSGSTSTTTSTSSGASPTTAPLPT